MWSKVLTARERETHIWMGKLPMTNISSTLKIFLKVLMLLPCHDPWMTFTESRSDPRRGREQGPAPTLHSPCIPEALLLRLLLP